MKTTFRIAVFFSLWFNGCQTTDKILPPISEEGTTFRSEYFVFVGIDTTEPLIIPVDFNWEKRDNAQVFIEWKCWEGGRHPWPIVYFTDVVDKVDSMPGDWYDLPAISGISWTPPDSSGNAVLQLVKEGNTDTTFVNIPNSEALPFHETPRSTGRSRLIAMKTTVTLEGVLKPGWLIRERIWSGGTPKADTGSFFSRFHWIPLVKNDTLYLFRDNGTGSQFAAQWTAEGDSIFLTTDSVFTFQETTFEADSISGRSQVPVSWTISHTGWDLDLSISGQSIYGQTGHGSEKPGGKALYRQGLVEGRTAGGTPVHGMVELILED